MTNIAPIVRKNHANPVGVGALDDPRAMCKRYAQTVGSRLPPAVSLDECRRKRLAVSGIQNPLCAGMRRECGAAAERKACPKPKGFGGDERSPNS